MRRSPPSDNFWPVSSFWQCGTSKFDAFSSRVPERNVFPLSILKTICILNKYKLFQTHGHLRIDLCPSDSFLVSRLRHRQNLGRSLSCVTRFPIQVVLYDRDQSLCLQWRGQEVYRKENTTGTVQTQLLFIIYRSISKQHVPSGFQNENFVVLIPCTDFEVFSSQALLLGVIIFESSFHRAIEDGSAPRKRKFFFYHPNCFVTISTIYHGIFDSATIVFRFRG